MIALISWILFAEGITRSTTGMVSNANIMTKVYFPWFIMPLSGIISPQVDFVIAFAILILMMAYYGFIPTIAIVLLPAFIILALLTSLAVGLWFIPFCTVKDGFYRSHDRGIVLSICSEHF